MTTIRMNAMASIKKVGDNSPTFFMLSRFGLGRLHQGQMYLLHLHR